jgi:hypothetical protein
MAKSVRCSYMGLADRYSHLIAKEVMSGGRKKCNILTRFSRH